MNMNNRLDTTKKRICLRHIVLLWVSICVTTAQAQNWEMQGALQMFSPKSGMWDKQVTGAEGKLIYWWDTEYTEELGLAFSIGNSKWEVPQYIVGDTRDSGTGRTEAVEGKVSYMPLGVSLVSRRNLSNRKRIKTTFDVGLHYMVCNSKLYGVETLYVGGNPIGANREGLACDDGLVTRISMGLEWALKSKPSPILLLLSGGYQFDLDKGNAAVDNWVTINTELPLEAFYLQFGLAMPFK